MDEVTLSNTRLSPADAHLIAVHEPTNPAGIALVIHGGRSMSNARVRPWQFAVLRLRPIAAAIGRIHPELAVFRLQLATRGWNAAGVAPIAAARWAMGELRAQYHGVPIVLVGHSMGARTSLRVADDPDVVGVVGLAPWLPPDEPITQLAGVPLRLIHGARDRIIPEPTTRPYLARVVDAGIEVDSSLLPGTGHAMLRRAADWNRLTADGVAAFVSRAAFRASIVDQELADRDRTDRASAQPSEAN